jgi:hypothetical protein
MALSEDKCVAFFNNPTGSFIQVVSPPSLSGDRYSEFRDVLEFQPEEIRTLCRLFREWERTVLEPVPESLSST